MSHKYAPVLAAIVLACPQSVSALALGDLKVRSSLNEPLDAEIELLPGGSEEIADLRAALASREEFQRAGMERPYLLTRLRFQLEDRPGGKAAIRISTKQPVREPFLNFLLELNWPKGRLVREYTALLDPPVYSAAASAAVRGPVVRAHAEEPPAEPAAPPLAERSAPEPQAGVAEPAAQTPGTTESAAPAPFAGDAYGPVAAGETLWAIAREVRPERSITPQRMMIALLRANPDAFVQGNVNALKAGYVLRIPDRQAIDAVDPSQAIADIRQQQTLWEDYRQGVARSPRPEPKAGVAPSAPQPAVPAERAVAPSEPAARLEIVAGGSESGVGGTGTEAGALRREVSLLQEDLDGRRQEVTELRARLAEAETLIQDLQRLIKLKDETLAALQQQALLTRTREETEEGEGEPTVAGGEPGLAAAEEAAAVPPPESAQAPAVEAAVPVEAAVLEVAGRSAASGDAAPAPAEALPPEPALAPAETTPVAVAPAQPPVAVVAKTVAAPTEEARPKPVKPAVPVAAEPAQAPSLLDSLAGGSTLVWGGLAGVLALAGGLFSLRRRRPAEVLAEPEAFAQEPSTMAAAQVALDPTSEISSQDGRFSSPGGHEPTSESSRSEDPMAEVNVYLAYERFDQAEEVARRAVSEYPDRPEYRLKLLEVHHAAKDAEAFERDAAQLRDAAGEASPLMERARGWWSELVPGRPLLATGAGAVAAFAATTVLAGGEGELDRTLVMSPDEFRAATSSSTFEEERLELPSGDIDFDLGLEGVSAESAGEAFDFDLDLAAGAESAKEPSSSGGVDLELPAQPALAGVGAEATEALDLDLEAGAGASAAEPESASFALDLQVPGSGSTQTSGDSLDLDLDSPVDQTLGSVGEAVEPDSFTMGLSLEPRSSEAQPLAPAAAAAAIASMAEDSAFAIEPDLSGLVSGGGAASGGAGTGADALVSAFAAEGSAAGDPGSDALWSEAVVFTGTVPLSDPLADVEGAAPPSDFASLDGTSFATEPVVFTGTVPLDEALSGAADEMALEGVEAGLTPATSLDAQVGGDEVGLTGEAAADELPVLELEAPVAEPAPSGGVPEEVFATLVSEGAGFEVNGQDFALPPELDLELEPQLGAGEVDEASLFLDEEGSVLEEIDTKLDLARAYIDMGDAEGARGILGEVLSEGSDIQRDEAEHLLAKLA